MNRIAVLFLQGLALGLGIGLCLAGAAGLLYRAVHSGDPNFQAGHTLLYLFIVGFVMGTLAGWCMALHMVLVELLTSLFLKICELVPVPAAAVGKEWAEKMVTFFREILAPMPGFLRKLAEWFFIVRFEDYGRINRSLEKAKKGTRQDEFSPRWMALVILHYLLEPIWIFFYVVYAILLLVSCLFWSLAFFR